MVPIHVVRPTLLARTESVVAESAYRTDPHAVRRRGVVPRSVPTAPAGHQRAATSARHAAYFRSVVAAVTRASPEPARQCSAAIRQDKTAIRRIVAVRGSARSRRARVDGACDDAHASWRRPTGPRLN